MLGLIFSCTNKQSPNKKGTGSVVSKIAFWKKHDKLTQKSGVTKQKKAKSDPNKLTKSSGAKKQKRASQDDDKLHVKHVTLFDIRHLFVSQQKKNSMKCPTGKERREEEPGKVKGKTSTVYEPVAEIKKYVQTINFDIIKLDEQKLEVPAFKQFKNNMTDFTAGGEEEFKKIIQAIRDFLGENTDGHGVTLNIKGSASQIPTSFDPSKPNNNINPDGSSIKGQTSIENNKKLALARATELANKIKQVFPKIEIDIPTLDQIKLGETAWDAQAQKKLNEAHIKGDQAAKQAVYAPFQKDQFVLVESKESKAKTIKPEALKMYTLIFAPRLFWEEDTVKKPITSRFIVSEKTFMAIGDKRFFDSVQERQALLDEIGLQIYREERNGIVKWYLLQSNEMAPFNIEGEYERIYALYKLGIVNDQNEKILERVITEVYLQSNK